MERSLPPTGSRWYHAVSGVLGLYPADFGGKLAVDERHRLRNGLGIAVIARPEHTKRRANNSRRTANYQNQRNERTGHRPGSPTAARATACPARMTAFLTQFKEFYCAFAGLCCLLCGFLHDRCCTRAWLCCDLRLYLGRRLLAR